MTGLTGMFSNRYQFDDIPDQRGKTAIVTGGTSGIGASIAAGFATAGAKVIIVGATEEHAKGTADSINEKVQQNSTGSPKFPSGNVSYKIVDFGDLKAVEAFGQEMLKECDIRTDEQGIPEQGLGSKGRPAREQLGGLHYLVCNAGIGVAAPGLTKDGLANQSVFLIPPSTESAANMLDLSLLQLGYQPPFPLLAGDHPAAVDAEDSRDAQVCRWRRPNRHAVVRASSVFALQG